MWFAVARTIWKVARLVWSGFLLLFLIAFLANLATAENPKETAFVKAVVWLFYPGLIPRLVLMAVALIIAITISAWVITGIEKHRTDSSSKREEHKRADSVKDPEHERIDPQVATAVEGSEDSDTKIKQASDDETHSQQSGAQKSSGHAKDNEKDAEFYHDDPVLQAYLQFIISANEKFDYAPDMGSIGGTVPLNDVFTYFSKQSLSTLSDQQQKELEELRRRPDLGDEEREERVQRIRAIWYSQLQQEQSETESQQITVQEILQQLQASRPAAVVLGAPGSGKSTVMRWLALQMAKALLSPGAISAHPLSPVQIPILIRLREYAMDFVAEHLSFVQFITRQFANIHPILQSKLIAALEQGRCLLLFDGFDEVGSDSLRRQMAEAIQSFISRYSGDGDSRQSYNRFIITSRIVGYEREDFPNYTAYTILELTDGQVEQFLENWCTALERHTLMLQQAMAPLTAEQDEQCMKSGQQQRDQLLAALSHNPDLRRLARYPFILTILVSMQPNGVPIPRHRIEQYREVIRMLLQAWERSMEGKVVPGGIAVFSERMLDNFAYQLHTDVAYLTEQQVYEGIRKTIIELYGPAPETTESVVRQVVQVIQETRGPFVEVGQGLFGFSHRVFQEYFVAVHLLRKSFDELVQFISRHLNAASWREPLLLVIAIKSLQSGASGWQECSEFLQAVAYTSDDYEAVLHRHLLFAANAIVECDASGIDEALQTRIIGDLLILYGGPRGAAPYSRVREQIEKVMLLWLQGLPPANSQQRSWPPVLTAWRKALCDDTSPAQQEGAVHLLAVMAPDLHSCPRIVLLAFAPLLLQLTDILDLPCPAEVMEGLHLPRPHPSSLKVEEYACVALRLLDKIGPAGWLHEAWLRWSVEQPTLLERLAQHSLELEYLITPAALPDLRGGPNWVAQFNLGLQWGITMQRIAGGEQHIRLLRDACQLQTQLLQASNTARYPIAFFIKQLLTEERAGTMSGQTWRTIWNALLQKEMVSGRSSTYRQCLNLRLLLHTKNRQERQKIANELMEAMVKQDEQGTQAVIAITNIYLRDMREIRDLIDLPALQRLPGFQYIPYLQDTQYLQDVLNLRDLQDLIDLRELRDLQTITDLRYLPGLIDLRNQLDRDRVIRTLCNMLGHDCNTSCSLHLFALYSALAGYVSMPLKLKQHIQNSLQRFEGRTRPLITEYRLLLAAITRRLNAPMASSNSRRPTPSQRADARVTALYVLKQRSRLTQPDVEEIVAACNDLGEPSKEKWRELTEDRFAIAPITVREFAWKLTGQSFKFEERAYSFLIEALGDPDAMICAASARLLQRNSSIPASVAKQAAQRVIKLLLDDELSHSWLEFPDHTKIWRLDDILFETLEMLAE